MSRIQYGATNETTALDEDGSTISIERKFDNYSNLATRKHYAIRVRVHDKKEELTEFLKFTDTLTSEKLDAAFEFLRTKQGDAEGWWYVVKKWTEIVR